MRHAAHAAISGVPSVRATVLGCSAVATAIGIPPKDDGVSGEAPPTIPAYMLALQTSVLSMP